MASKVKPIPADMSLVIPRLFCRDPLAELEFCEYVFESEEQVRRPGLDGGISHALIKINGAMIMIESEWPNFASRAPALDASSPVAVFIYVGDVDQTLARAAERGAKLISPAADQFWGDRTGWIMDPQGHVWTVATRVEETTEEERQARVTRMMAGQAWKT